MPDRLDIRPELRDQLLGISTATLASQLVRRGLRHAFIARVRPVDPRHSRMCGPAFTLRFIPLREDLAVAGSVANQANPQRAAIEQMPPGHVLVIDTGGELACGNLGDILAARLLQRGVAGVVSDGAMRDCAELSEVPLPVFCAGFAAPPSYTGLMAADTGLPIGCGGVAVFPGDVIVTDRDGALVIPRHLAEEVARDGAEQERIDRFVRRRIDRGASIVGLYPPNEAAMAAYRRWVEAGEDDATL